MSSLYRITGTILLIGVVLASCATVNNFEEYAVEGSDLAADLRTPPSPEIDTDYFVTIDSENPIGTVLSVGSSIAKATEVKRAEEKMLDALAVVDVPAIVFEQTFLGVAEALQGRMIGARRGADYFLDLEIREWGISAGSSGGQVALTMRATARLYHQPTGELVWRRNIQRNDEATPYMFGIGGPAGNIVTAAVLSEMTSEQMAEGFERLAQSLATEISREIEGDLHRARYGR